MQQAKSRSAWIAVEQAAEQRRPPQPGREEAGQQQPRRRPGGATLRLGRSSDASPCSEPPALSPLSLRLRIAVSPCQRLQQETFSPIICGLPPLQGARLVLVARRLGGG